MSLTPFSRENMRSLKAQMDKEINDMKIDSAVKFIYVNAVYFAETKADTVYRHLLNAYNSHGGHITPISNVAKYATQYNQTYRISKEYVLENME